MNRKQMITDALSQGFSSVIQPVCGPFELALYVDGGEPKEPCLAILGESDGAVLARAAAYDTYPFSKATKDNEPMWSLGDAIEFFVQPPGRDDYFECHVTPEGHTLQLRFDHYKKDRKSPLETYVYDCQLKVQSFVIGDVWHAELRIPLTVLGVESVAGLRFAVGRYNYATKGKPEVSSFPALDDSYGFHNPPAWFEVEGSIQ